MLGGMWVRTFATAGIAAVLVAGAVVGVAGQDGAGNGPVLRRGDSVTLDLGQGGTGRLTLPGGDTVIPGDGAVLRTLTELDVEGAARTSVLLESGSFQLEGRGGGPRIRVLGLEVLPGVGEAAVTIDAGGAHLAHGTGGPVVLRLGPSPDSARIVLTEGGAVDVTRSGNHVRVSVAEGATGRVLLAEASGWSQLAPGTAIQAAGDAQTPEVTAGELAGGAQPPEIPAATAATGSEQVAARVGTGGLAAIFVADGSGARAEAGAEIVGRWSGGPSDRQATLAAGAGTVHVALRSTRTGAETPAHRITTNDAAGLTLTVTDQGEHIAVDGDGGPATITNALPHPGPGIRLTVAPGDAVDYVAGDPAQGITYRVPAGNQGPVTFAVGSKQLQAPAGTEVTFRPDGQVEVTWPEGPEELFAFAFSPETLLPSVAVPYTGLPDLLPPPPVSPSTP